MSRWTVTNPYRVLPIHTRWSRAVANTEGASVDPGIGFPFRIEPADKIATAGSCFAQHIGRYCRLQGLNFHIVESGHYAATEELKALFSYGVFSARYGNIYTPRQLLQLFHRAYGKFTPLAESWAMADGSYVDPLRPNIQPGDFTTLQELRADRCQHLQSVRRMFESLDYFIFTFGLTECWYDAEDGTVFPVCPGIAGGIFDPSRHQFKNFTLQEIVADMSEFIDALQTVNKSARTILTVSPVPLVATAINRHVLVSTISSKSVLRVACDEIISRYKNVAYFPSYEIITGPHARGMYFGPDLRSITEPGVAHVMRVFSKHATSTGCTPDEVRPSVLAENNPANQITSIIETLCQENLIENSLKNI